jgi:hypothetical protein
LFVDPEETEARNDCAGEGQQQFNRPRVAVVRSEELEMTRNNGRDIFCAVHAGAA